MSTQLTQLKTVKARLGIAAADTADDAILTAAINAVSQRFAKECNREFDYQAAATFQFRAHEMDLRVDRYPVSSVAAFETKSSETDGWQAVTGDALPDCTIGPAGNILELAAPLGVSRQLGRVTFAGGYVLPGGAPVDSVPALPDDLEQACVEQCAYWYQRKSQLGLVSLSGDGGSLSQFRSLDLLPNVLAVIKNYERFMP